MSKQRTIAIVTNELDPHADVVIGKLRRGGHNIVRLNFERKPFELPISFGFSPERGCIRTSSAVVPLDQIDAVWWRKPLPIAYRPELRTDEKRFVRAETDHALQGLWACLDCYWLSHPEAIRRANWKPAQLKRAAALGLEIPKTLITNDPDQVLQFYEECEGRMIYKTFTPAVSRADAVPTAPSWVVYSNVVELSQLRRLADKVRTAPCLFQQYVDKRCELRVTIIGDEIFVAEIDSQANAQTAIDWRRPHREPRLKKGTLPDAVSSRLFALVRSYDLEFSAIDLIVTQDGRHVFLESNPNGQWYFVEACVPEFKMADCVASLLVEGNRQFDRSSPPAMTAVD